MSIELKEMGFSTKAVHAGERAPQPDFQHVVAPVHHSVGYYYRAMAELDAIFEGERSGYVYGRYGNPTVNAFERAMALLEGGEAALAFGSGMGAIHAALLGVGLRAGSAALVAQDVYGATYALFSQLLESQGVSVQFIDMSDLEAVRCQCAALEPLLLFVETVSNPLLKVADIAALAEIAHANGALLVVDNTFASPYLCRPLSLGADVVVHSATKYIGGHGDVLGGVIVTATEWRDAIYEVQKITGANLAPQDAWLLTRGIKTLSLRMREHCANAGQIAQALSAAAGISRVIYPGLGDHPQHSLATRMFEGLGYGGMVAFELCDGDRTRVFRFFDALRLCQPAPTLGDVYTLVLYPAHSSHRALSPAERKRVGIGDGLVRMSVGIECVQDIVADLEQAIQAVQ